jgi:glycosyltransferase involved in cell wall biosynthesis
MINYISDNQIQEWENQNIVFIPKIENDELLADYFRLADAFVLPSREDNLPNVIMEAFACGCPIIGFPVGGIKEHVVINKTGVIAESLTGSSLAKAINHFIIMKDVFSKDEIRKYAESHFSGAKQSKEYLNIFQSFE